MTSRFFRTLKAVASIWFNGSCGANPDPDRSEATMAEDIAGGLKGAIRVDAGELRGHVDAMVRSSVEETVNALLLRQDQPARRLVRGSRWLLLRNRGIVPRPEN
jgi:hypothetical protein